MKKYFAVALLLASTGLALAQSEPRVDPLPNPTSNNAVAILRLHGRLQLFSFMGIGPKKASDAITSDAYVLDGDSGAWSQIKGVPGTVGRIGAMAVGARDEVFLMGGYVIDSHGAEMPVPDVNTYVPPVDRWVRDDDMSLAVADAVVGVYEDRYIYLVGGRSERGIVSDVQVYDIEKNRWSSATPSPGAPVFGHAGALVGDTIVYVDGAKKNPAGDIPGVVASDECWMGKIDHHDHARIKWTQLPAHPGSARFRIAGGGSEKDEKIYFSGGTDDPYDYNGIGFDGKPAEPSPVTFAYNLRSGKWETLNENTPDPTMDHRGLLVPHHELVIIGGMEKGQQVTGRVSVLPKEAVAATPAKTAKK